MPKIYRAMKADGELPKVEQSARGLGVRVPEDIRVNNDGDVQRGNEGLSVAPSWRELPSHRIPRRLKSKLNRLEKDAAGPPTDFCWRMGEGPFELSNISDQLVLIPDDRPGIIMHGVVSPRDTIALGTYRTALAETREAWVVDED